jgi:hypothetical protein
MMLGRCFCDEIVMVVNLSKQRGYLFGFLYENKFAAEIKDAEKQAGRSSRPSGR